MTCSPVMFRDTMLRFYRKSPYTVGWLSPYRPVISAMHIVSKFRPDAHEAYLVIYGDRVSSVWVSEPYDSQPPSLPDSVVFNNWLNGWEVERMRCALDGKWYYVFFPAKLYINSNPLKGVRVDKALLILGGLILGSAIIGLGRGR